MLRTDNFCLFLKTKLTERQSRNKAYSLRAFATFLKVDQSTLTKVLKGERQFSLETQQRCVQVLAVDDQERQALLDMIQQRHGDMINLDDQVPELLGHWYYWAILELIKLPNFRHTEEDICARLGLDGETVKTALERLEMFGFIRYEQGRFGLLHPNNSWSNTEKTSLARKKLQQTFLEKSLVALEEVPFEDREHSSLTIAVDKARLPEFKQKLKELRQEFGKIAQKKGSFTDVYQLTISLYPLTRDESL